MTKHKTAELEGDLLDAAVAQAEGLAVARVNDVVGCQLTETHPIHGLTAFGPSSRWEHGGPIIEREGIAMFPQADRAFWVGGYGMCLSSGWFTGWHAEGRTPLIAAMRAYVAREFGEEVELP